jgi:hypothetical protein
MEDVGMFMDIWSILQTFGIVCDHLVYVVVIWNIFSRFGMLNQEKSGNPGLRYQKFQQLFWSKRYYKTNQLTQVHNLDLCRKQQLFVYNKRIFFPKSSDFFAMTSDKIRKHSHIDAKKFLYFFRPKPKLHTWRS